MILKLWQGSHLFCTDHFILGALWQCSGSSGVKVIISVDWIPLEKILVQHRGKSFLGVSKILVVVVAGVKFGRTALARIVCLSG